MEDKEQTLAKRSFSVAISEMPTAPSKPILRDSARLLSLAAFLFSIITGVFAIYQSWRNDQLATVERVSKLMDDYYAKQETLAKLNTATQMGFANLLQSQLRGIAAKTVPQALRVRGELDDGTWQALAQINDAERNFRAAEQAWLTSIEQTRDMAIYLFGLRGLALNQIQQGKRRDGDIGFQKAIDEVRSDATSRMTIVNNFPGINRDMFESETHGIWIASVPVRDCAFLVPHFDRALALLTAVDNASNVNAAVHGQIIMQRASLDFYRKERAACPQRSDSLPIADEFCALSENLIFSASTGFSAYRGKAESDGSSFESRIDYADGYCNIDVAAKFHCDWPENNEVAVNRRKEVFLKMLSSCLNLGARASPYVQSRDGRYSASETTSIMFPKKAEIAVRRLFRKPSSSSQEGRWSIGVDIIATSTLGELP